MPDQQPGPPVAVDQVAVFADPAQAGFLCPGFVQERRAVDAGAPLGLRLLVLKPTSQGPQAPIDDPVVVPAPAVAGHFQAARRRLGIDVIVEADRDNTADPWQQRLNRLASGVLHPGHLPVMARVEPAL